MIWAAGGGVALLGGIWALLLLASVGTGHGTSLWLVGVSGLVGAGLGMGLRAIGNLTDGSLQEKFRDQNMLLDSALSYMSQGLCMFDAAGHLVLWNKRFAEMYKVEGRLQIGFTLRDILQHRLEAGTLDEDPDAYAERAKAAAQAGKTFRHVFELPDGRKILVTNEARPSGGWVSTHEDITERQQVEQERATIRDQEQRRAIVEFSHRDVPSAG